MHASLRKIRWRGENAPRQALRARDHTTKISERDAHPSLSPLRGRWIELFSSCPAIAWAERKSRLRLHRLCRKLHRLGRRGVDLLDKRLDRGAGYRPDVEIGGARLGEEIRILHRGVQR